MANGNIVEIVGNVTRDPELRFTKSGVAVSAFGIAYNNRRLNKQTNEWDEDVSFFDVTCWNDLAENVAGSIQKGMRVMVSGRLEQQSWETAEGDKRTKVEIQADEVAPSLRWAMAQVQKNERKPGGNGNGNGNTRPAPNQAPAPVYDDSEPF